MNNTINAATQKNAIDGLVAHRGASAHAPENTLVAFESAIEQGAQWIEFDVSPMGDGTPIVMHDDTTRRCSDTDVFIGDLDMKQLKTIDAGGWFGTAFTGETIPLLSEVLDWMTTNTVQANIELKRHPHQQNTAEFVQPILTIIDQYPDLWERLLMTSFDSESLDYCQEQAPSLKLGSLFDRAPVDWLERTQQWSASYLHINYQHLSKELLATAAKHRIIVKCYTPPDPALLERWLPDGLTSVIVNSPKLFLTHIQK